jgi:8-oxo-(d)GTP phosphatase
LILVRHASAGDREDWPGDDRMRPLDERGRRQAQRLVETLAGFEITRVISSPSIRCMQTVEPLAAALGLSVDLYGELGEHRQTGEGVELVRSLAGEDVAACVHGGLSEAVFGSEWGMKKGGVLVIDFGPRVLAQLDAAAQLR